ncbi:Uncharacterized protein APZ42_004760 [Daphnia magna]|uniref:Uncharacterized protein n=1 Tax=Daphnia magna TaxID=35525 RepID=A0A164GV25_9CRUS|nr:Uncharacterized protein APZ42_004760 [Daphnia magna]
MMLLHQEKLCLSHCTESYPKKQFQHLSKYDGLPQRAMDNLLLGRERKFVIPSVLKTEWYLSGQVKSITVARTFGQHSVDTSDMGLLGIVSSNSSVG